MHLFPEILKNIFSTRSVVFSAEMVILFFKIFIDKHSVSKAYKTSEIITKINTSQFEKVVKPNLSRKM